MAATNMCSNFGRCIAKSMIVAVFLSCKFDGGREREVTFLFLSFGTPTTSDQE